MLLFSENIDEFVGQTVKAKIFHKIYGNQAAIIRSFQPLIKEDRIGFVANNHEVFVYSDEIENITADKNMVIIYGTLQTIIIEKI